MAKQPVLTTDCIRCTLWCYPLWCSILSNCCQSVLRHTEDAAQLLLQYDTTTAGTTSIAALITHIFQGLCDFAITTLWNWLHASYPEMYYITEQGNANYTNVVNVIQDIISARKYCTVTDIRYFAKSGFSRFDMTSSLQVSMFILSREMNELADSYCIKLQ